MDPKISSQGTGLGCTRFSVGETEFRISINAAAAASTGIQETSYENDKLS